MGSYFGGLFGHSSGRISDLVPAPRGDDNNVHCAAFMMSGFGRNRIISAGGTRGHGRDKCVSVKFSHEGNN